jgi:hypothetical protein
MNDFEFEEIWDDTLNQIIEILECFFHLGNYLYKKLFDAGFKQECIENEEFRNCFNRMMALELVSNENVYIHQKDEASELFEC